MTKCRQRECEGSREELKSKENEAKHHIYLKKLMLLNALGGARLHTTMIPVISLKMTTQVLRLDMIIL